MPLRLAILETDTPVPATHALYSGYLGVFTHLFTRAASPIPLSAVLTLTGHHIVPDNDNDPAFLIALPTAPAPSAAYPPLDEVDAILVTGSKHNAFDDHPWIEELVGYVRKAVEGGRVKVLGVCFGHQIVARAMGVRVGRAEGWEVSVTEARLTGRGREVFGGRETLQIQQMHRDQVFGLPPNAELLASTDACANHGFLIPERVITVQGHPEFTAAIMREILDLRHDTGLFPEELYRAGLARNGDHHDGVLIAQAFLKFLLAQEQ
ncbi:hypothetical protein C8A05DRAFT_45647 [Staphylotrichum tortipilum]|uniref:Glutamine amidotransferase domain-containing protein n=1 Tax=Staphylotrichum tortipilum TaxID=2831512 RepID=A0AAN6RRP8_9PEZI|nr:hypothetical protein C8A05DRAFT_45647 [Staphylotrichum longicolle]